MGHSCLEPENTGSQPFSHCIALVCISAIIITTFAVIWEGHSADSAIYDILELQILPFFIIARLLHPLVYELNE